MRKNQVIAMILAGGQGTRLGLLTKNTAKPAVNFGGNYKIIDFPLSNCINSGIRTIGVLTQYKPKELEMHIGSGESFGIDKNNGEVAILQSKEAEYTGTADAIYKNINYIDKHNPENVLILSGDHIYKMDYAKMLEYHNAKNADATIAVMQVPNEEASRFGIMNTREDLSIYKFEEKPKEPKSNLASMGIYIFKWHKLKQYLIEDENNELSDNDFGKNIFPQMLKKEKLFAYRFNGYWKDVGTVESLWEANMDILAGKFNLFDNSWKIYSKGLKDEIKITNDDMDIENSLVMNNCNIEGKVINSILFPGVKIGKNAIVKDSVIMANAEVEDNVIINKTIIDKESVIEYGTVIGDGNKVEVIQSKKLLIEERYVNS